MTETQQFNQEVLDLAENRQAEIDLNKEQFLNGLLQLVREKKLIPISSVFSEKEMRMMFDIGVKVGMQLMADELKTKI